jgi:ribonuclease BN (tRNA processing enzyme)
MNQPFRIRRNTGRKNNAFHGKEAATIALKANVKQLVLGHYSTVMRMVF